MPYRPVEMQHKRVHFQSIDNVPMYTKCWPNFNPLKNSGKEVDSGQASTPGNVLATGDMWCGGAGAVTMIPDQKRHNYADIYFAQRLHGWTSPTRGTLPHVADIAAESTKPAPPFDLNRAHRCAE